jgi:hypothetical protein
MDYWKQDRKLDITETKSIYNMSRHIGVSLGITEFYTRQKIEIAITEFLFEHDLQFVRHSKSGDTDERVVDTGEAGR